MEIHTGIDIIEIERFKKAYEKYREKFLKKIFFNDELKLLKENLIKLCISFSLKESIWKALPEKTQQKLLFKDIKIGWKENKPFLLKKIRNYKILFSYSINENYVITFVLLIEP
ncbi:MAG: 4'-phosphopantetheinyl transferase superfamily protein [Candidatus Omnitrophica bacterium]|nr:4'-phosphopantetheinyl transferase superfamily protein [Candidatus Omnitrophota bacterium]MCM8809161.1 4'-phosphopantetheinyl transferase superfamily protein [Candidatus Omnitrophota bacterium]MCM8811411.1 4'-phosphopantetheinyl transferase superfamily protein [Candidatus Omnitrophota bacterium]